MGDALDEEVGVQAEFAVLDGDEVGDLPGENLQQVGAVGADEAEFDGGAALRVVGEEELGDGVRVVLVGPGGVAGVGALPVPLDADAVVRLDFQGADGGDGEGAEL